MNMAKPPSPSIARATGIRVRQTATATGPERPDNQTWTPRTGGYRNPNPAPSLAHHATLTGRCLKPTVSRSSPCVSGRMRSDYFKAAERLANMSDLRLTLPATDHTPKDRLSGDSRRETTHTKERTPYHHPHPMLLPQEWNRPMRDKSRPRPSPKIST
jgi:hypothetical protein